LKKINRPLCVKEGEIFIAKNVYNHEAYIYRFINLLTGMIYLGYHLGDPFDEYWHSSTCEEFAKLFASSKPIFRYEIMTYGTKFDMQNEEHQMLKEVDARNNPLYYNKSNGNPAFKEDNIDLCVEIVNDIKLGKYRKEEKELIKDLIPLERLQARSEDYDSKHVNEIYKRLPTNGNTDDCEDIIIWEDYDGSRIIGDGNHTLKATSRHKHCVDLFTSCIPPEVTSTVTFNERILIGKMFNKQSKIIKKANSEEDIVNTLVDHKVRLGLDFDSQYNKKVLSVVFGLHNNDMRKKYIPKAENKWKKQILDDNGLTWINYKDSDEDRQVKVTLMDNLRDKDTIVLDITSGMTNKIDVYLNKALTCKVNENKHKIVMVVNHPQPSDKKKWNKEWPTIEERINTLFSKMKDVQVNDKEGNPIPKMIVSRTLDVEYMKTQKAKSKTKDESDS